MVWFHGGAWTLGSANAPLYDGSALARRGDVVVVGVNHRLGALGYLSLGELFGEEVAGLRVGRGCSTWCWRSSGCATTSPPSAATPTT